MGQPRLLDSHGWMDMARNLEEVCVRGDQSSAVSALRSGD